MKQKKASTFLDLMENVFKLIRWSGHWFPTTDADHSANMYLSGDFWRSFIFISTLPLQLVPCISDLILKIPDMPKVIINSISTMYCIHTLFRVVFTVLMGNRIRKIFKEFDKCKVPLPFLLIDRQLGQETTQTAFRSANKVFLVIIIGANVTGCLFTVTPFVMSYEARIQKLKESSTNGSIPNVLVYEAYYPFDISGFPIYELTVLFQAFCGFIWINMISTSDALYLAAIIRITEEFHVLNNMLSKLSNTKSFKVYNDKPDELIGSQISRRLNNIEWPRDANILVHSWINHHQLVLRILKEVRSVFSVFVFGVVGINAASLVLLAYVGATIKDVTALLSIVSFLFVVMTQLLSFSYFSVKLTSKADEMSQQLLWTNWWEAPASYQSALKLVCLRASKKVTISGMGYFDLDLELFLSIVQSAASYFVVLMNMTTP